MIMLQEIESPTKWGAISKQARDTLNELLPKELALSQSAHAKASGIPRQMLWLYEQGKQEPGFSVIDKLLYVVGMDMQWKLVPVSKTTENLIAVDIGSDLHELPKPDPQNYNRRIRQYFFWPGMLIRLARKKANISQQNLALLSGTSQAAISAYEHDIHQPALSTLERIVGVLGLRPSVRLLPYDISTELHWLHQARFPEKAMQRVQQWSEEHVVMLGDKQDGFGYRPNPLIDMNYHQYRRSLLRHVS